MEDVAYDDIALPASLLADSVLYFGTLSLRARKNLDVLTALMEKNRFSEIFVDLNVRPPFSSTEAIRFAVMSATVLKVSEEELPFVVEALEGRGEAAEQPPYDTFARSLAVTYPKLKLILVTRGGDGAYAYDVENDREYRALAVPTRVVSTVGAGDSFSAAFLSRYMKKGDVASSLAFASKLAALVVSKKEAVPSYSVQDVL